MDELSWVESLKRRFPGKRQDFIGPGDDAAVWPLTSQESVVLTVDSLIEGTHYRDGWLTDSELARRALAINFSDLAAMAAEPIGVLIAIVTKELPGRFGEAFWDGIEQGLDEFGAELLGGNVTRGEQDEVTVTAVGRIETGRAIRRSTASPGDAIWVTGFPGWAALEREALIKGGSVPAAAKGRWRAPRARIREAGYLAGVGGMSAAIDISDGLALDLRRLLEASGVGAELDLAPLTEVAPEGPSPSTILGGGEDYELLFTSTAGAPPSVEAFETRFDTPLHRLGTITEAGLRITNRGESLALESGWDPFRSD